MIGRTREPRRGTMTLKGTTILSVRHKGNVVIAGDGQVTLETTVMKQRARKVRRLYNDKILAGFAGATADAFRPVKIEIEVISLALSRRDPLEGISSTVSPSCATRRPPRSLGIFPA